MSNFSHDLAVFGGQPVFDRPLFVGQLNFPEWERIEESFNGVFKRRYYTNHGPLAQELESKLEEFFGVRHAMCVTNATIGLMIAAVALELKGKVIMPAFTFIATAQSLSWAGLEPVFCDVDPETHLMSVTRAEELMGPEVSAILGVHLWGNPCAIDDLRQLADAHGVRLYFDAAQAFGSTHNNQPIGQFGELEVFSFHATKVLSSMEGGCICTNDDQLAARIRNIRSSYGSGPAVPIPLTGNGRFSEAQAAMALLGLEDYPSVEARNRKARNLYHEKLSDVPGIRFPVKLPASTSNDQYVVLEIEEAEFGLSRDQLTQILHSENVMSRNYFTPGVHQSVPYKDWYPQYYDALPVTDQLCRTVLQLPSGQGVSSSVIEKICGLIKSVHQDSLNILQRLKQV